MIYIPLGRVCQSTCLVKELDLRKQAYPFDWITSPIESMVQCLENDFAGFHEEVRLDQNDWTRDESQIVDKLGFRFHHDYPTSSTLTFEDNEYSEDPIRSSWKEYYPVVYDKYMRRIQRFRDAMREPNVIGICRRPVEDCARIRAAIQKTYNRSLMIVTDTTETSSDPMIRTIDSGSDWFNLERWKSELPALVALQTSHEGSHGFIS